MVFNGAAISGATSSTYTLTADEGGETVSVVARYTDSAGLRETVESAGVSIQAAFSLGAIFVHALVDGAACDISAVGTNGAAGAALASGVTSNGLVTFDGLIPVSGGALLSCTGGTYIDEASGDTLGPA